MSKDDPISIINMPNLVDKKGALYFFSLYTKKLVNATLMKKLIIKRVEM